MPKCKNCGENITKFDKEVCPFCGCKNPLDANREKTCDVTQVIETIKPSDTEFKFVQHKKIGNFFLMMFLGLFGADAFYLGFVKEGILRIILNLLVISGLFCLFFFLKIFSLGISIGVSCGIVFGIYFILSFILCFIRKKDANGVLLR